MSYQPRGPQEGSAKTLKIRTAEAVVPSSLSPQDGTSMKSKPSLSPPMPVGKLGEDASSFTTKAGHLPDLITTYLDCHLGLKLGASAKTLKHFALNPKPLTT